MKTKSLLLPQIWAIAILLNLVSLCIRAQDDQRHIYPQRYFNMDSLEPFFFFSMSESYYIPEDDTSSHIIERDFLGHVDVRKNNYHVLKPKARANFLEACKLKEQDWVFRYHLAESKIDSIPLNDCEVVAFLDLYSSGDDRPFSEWNYMVGIALPAPITHDEFHRLPVLMSVAPKNPFAPGLQAIIFDSVSCDGYPNQESSKKSDASLCYRCLTDDYDIWVLDQPGTNYQYATQREMFVLDKEGKQLKQVYYHYSEGTAIPPINIQGRDNYYPHWIGLMLKDRGPCFSGFVDYLYSCQIFEWIEEDYRALELKCDNRH